MGVNIELANGSGRVIVGEEATIAQAGELRDALVKAADLAERVIVDFSGVQAMDITCLQLLCAAHRSLVERRKEMALTGSGLGLLRSTIETAGFPRKSCSVLKGQEGLCPLAQVD